jgi:hypothetical protein
MVVPDQIALPSGIDVKEAGHAFLAETVLLGRRQPSFAPADIVVVLVVDGFGRGFSADVENFGSCGRPVHNRKARLS